MICLGETVTSQRICSLMSDLQIMSDIHVNYAQTMRGSYFVYLC